MRRLVSFLLILLTAAGLAGAQVVNRLNVDDATFQRYAWGHMQEYDAENLVLADSLYQAGVAAGNYKYKCLGLSLEYPVRFAQGDYARMDEAVAEIKELLSERQEARSFYYATLHEYCQFLIHIGRVSDAMLEARAMERLASAEGSAAGRMYAHRIVGLIQSYRTNSHLAIRNFTQAADYCREARAEQELPNLHILIAQEYIKLKDFPQAELHCAMAEEYQEFFPSLRIKTRMTRAYIHYAQEDWEAFWQLYDQLISDPLYKMQAENEDRYEMDVAYLQSRGLFEQALVKADSLGTARKRLDKRQNIYAAWGKFAPAYHELSSLMVEKDSIYIRVQNEDMAILDAEMNNARLREEAERLKNANQTTILIGFLVMFAIAFLSILVSQWQLRENLEEMKKKNNQMLQARRAYHQALDAKEAENTVQLRILQNRQSNTLRL